jgi:hypothetical protein
MSSPISTLHDPSSKVFPARTGSHVCDTGREEARERVPRFYRVDRRDEEQYNVVRG